MVNQMVEAQELEELKHKMNAVHEVKEQMAQNFVVEQRCIADKSRLMFEFGNVESEYLALQKRLSEKYGDGINISLTDGTITHK